MKSKRTTRVEVAMDGFIRAMVELARRRDRILESPELDLAALKILASDYEVAGLTYGSADLRRRLEWYGSKMSTSIPLEA